MNDYFILIIVFGMISVGFGMYENLRYRLELITSHFGIKKKGVKR